MSSEPSAIKLHARLLSDGVLAEDDIGVRKEGGEWVLIACYTDDDHRARLEKKIVSSRAFRAHPAKTKFVKVDGYTC